MVQVEITPELVNEAERLLATRMTRAAIADRIGITRYVLGILARNRKGNGRSAASRPSGRSVPNWQGGIDGTTIRSVRRMLDAGVLSHVEIAREAGVSKNTVSDVATGKRRAVTLAHPPLSDGETFLPQPIRCSVCRAMISVIPCRACAATREKNRV